MQYQNRRNREVLIFVACVFFVVTATAYAQGKTTGYLYGDVIFAAEKRGDPAELAIGVKVRFQYDDEFIDLVSDEGGMIVEKLSTGKYTLVSASAADGTPLFFADEQNKCIIVRAGKYVDFDIVLKPPKE